MHRYLSGSRNAGLLATVCDLALIILAAPDASVPHDGIKPQRTIDNLRRGSLGC